MNLEFLNTATAKELEQFKSVCNQLLSRTYVVRTLYRPGKPDRLGFAARRHERLLLCAQHGRG